MSAAPQIGAPRKDAHSALRFILSDVGEREPGAIAAIIEGDAVTAIESVGLARLSDGATLTRSTLFRIASLSKPMAAQIVLTLAERGVLDLAAPIGDYLPFLQPPQSAPTIRQMLAMKSGLREDLALAYLATGDGARNDHSLDQRIALIAAQSTLNFKPGERTLYANTNYTLLQRACEHLTGKTFAALLQQYVFAPAGMQQAAFATPGANLAPMGLGYEKCDGAFSALEPLLDIGASGAVAASLDDIAAWRRWNHTEARDLWAQLTEPQRHNDGSPSAYGLGIGHQRLSGRRLHNHAGALGGWACEFLDFPDDDTAVIVLANRNDLNWYERAREAAILALGLVPDATATPRLLRDEAPAPLWTEQYANDELGYAITFSGAQNELCFEQRWMIADRGRYRRTLGVEPYSFEFSGAEAGPPTQINVIEGNVAATFRRCEPEAAAPAGMSGVYACADLPGRLTVFQEGGDTYVTIGVEWPAPTRYHVRRISGRLFRGHDCDTGKPADLHLLWSSDARDRIEVSIPRIMRMPYQRISSIEAASRPRFKSIKMGATS